MLTFHRLQHHFDRRRGVIREVAIYRRIRRERMVGRSKYTPGVK